MGLRQKLINSIAILFSFILLRQITGCTNNSSKADVTYGNSFFTKNCSHCHAQNDMADKTPGLVSLNNYDSLTLLKKLIEIRKDSVHGDYLKPVNYSSKEIDAIYAYIKDYFRPRY
jgi:cytochrome c553